MWGWLVSMLCIHLIAIACQALSPARPSSDWSVYTPLLHHKPDFLKPQACTAFRQPPTVAIRSLLLSEAFAGLQAAAQVNPQYRCRSLIWGSCSGTFGSSTVTWGALAAAL